MINRVAKEMELPRDRRHERQEREKRARAPAVTAAALERAAPDAHQKRPDKERVAPREKVRKCEQSARQLHQPSELRRFAGANFGALDTCVHTSRFCVHTCSVRAAIGLVATFVCILFEYIIYIQIRLSMSDSIELILSSQFPESI